VNQGVRTGQNDEAAIRLTREVSDAAFKICGVAASHGNEWHRERRNDSLDRTQHAHLRRGSEIANGGYANDVRRYELERLQPFARHRVFEADESGYISPWPRQAFDESGSDWIEHLRKNYRYRPGLLLYSHQCRQAAIHNDLGS
jgi:hypothetical protein